MFIVLRLSEVVVRRGCGDLSGNWIKSLVRSFVLEEKLMLFFRVVDSFI